MILVKPQVAPTTLLKTIPIERKQNICLCKAFKPLLIIVRLLGLFPIKWVHENNQCIYKKSLLWTFHTFFMTCFYTFIVASSLDVKKITNNKCLIIIMNEITNAIYGLYIVLLIIVAYSRFPEWIAALSQLSKAFQDGLYCSSAKNISIKSQYAYIALFVVTVTVRFSILLWLHLSTSYQISFNFVDLTYRLLQDVTYAFQAQFTSFIIVMSGTLACFEKLTKNVLQYTPLHPTKNIDESNSVTDFLGVVNYKLCKGTHLAPAKIMHRAPAEKIEYLRILHEELSLCIYAFNDSMNPQFLLHTVVELTVLIIHWYAVVAYLVYTFKDPAAQAIHIINCYYVLIHSSGLFLFLKNAQLLKNLVQELIASLLEYSTRIVRLDEHQQIRLFIEKLKQHRPFTASGIFTIDLGIAGPISANILTYVLVALQFEIPKE